MRLLDRAALIAMQVLAIVALTQHARADETFPDHVVKIVLPTASGSTTDTLARLVAERLSQTWSQPVIIENIAGGAMNVGATRVARSPPDGYTLMVAPPSPLTINDLLYHDLAYDPHKFAPVAMLAKIPNALVVRNDLPANSVAELIAYAKANPGKLTFGSQGVGSTAHLSGSQLEVLAGIKMVHVPYHGAVPALNDVMAGRIDMFFDTLTTSVPLWRGGKLRVLAVASPERAAGLPELPTVAESGVAGFRSVTWFALVAPPGTPAPIVDKINRDTNAALHDLAGKLTAIRLEPMPGSVNDAGRFIADETALWSKVITEAHIRLE